MNLAILGASSQIAKDLILSCAANDRYRLTLFARAPAPLQAWLAHVGLAGRYEVAGYAHFDAQRAFDGVMNFVGVGNPAQAAAMGATIFDVTLRFDELALDYVRQHPHCRYLFLSSGAAYGGAFAAPSTAHTSSTVALNDLQPQDWYGVAKLHAECRHRALAALPIVDLRVFNYFSHTQDVAARFLITDVIRAIGQASELVTSPENIVRDYLHPQDFYQLVDAVLRGAPMNAALDCYSGAPVDKLTLLDAMQARFGLQYRITDAPAGINATGFKSHYYSLNKQAAALGYEPNFTSLDGVLHEAALMLGAGGRESGR